MSRLSLVVCLILLDLFDLIFCLFVKETKQTENDKAAVSLQPLSTLSASQLQLLQERTMINTDLDLDSLDESASSHPLQLHAEAASVANSQTGLLHPLSIRNGS